MAVTATTLYYFADKWYMRAGSDVFVLSLLFVVIALALFDSYRGQAESARRLAAKRPGGAASAGSEGYYYGLFVVNFWFIVVAALATSLVASALTDEKIPPPNHAMMNSWKDVAFSTTPAALLVWLSSRNYI